MALLSEADLYEASHLVCPMATQAFCRALQADAGGVISQVGSSPRCGAAARMRDGAGHAYGHDHRMRLCCVPGGRDPILASRRAWSGPAVAPTTKQYLLHHGFPSRRSTAGKVAFRSTQNALAGGTVYRFNVCHILQVDEL